MPALSPRPAPVLTLPRRAFALSLGLSLIGVAPMALAAQTVTVRNAQLKVMKELRTRAELAEFYRFWDSRQPTNRNTDQERDWAFTLDVVSGGSAQRWLYQSNGMVARVASSVQQVLLIRNPSRFNLLIGAPKY